MSTHVDPSAVTPLHSVPHLLPSSLRFILHGYHLVADRDGCCQSLPHCLLSFSFVASCGLPLTRSPREGTVPILLAPAQNLAWGLCLCSSQDMLVEVGGVPWVSRPPSQVPAVSH